MNRVLTERFLNDDTLFQNAFAFAPIGMALVAPNGRWLRVNDSLCEIVGYTEKQLLELTFQELTHPDDLKLDLENVDRLLRGEIEIYQREKRYLHKNKSIVWVLLSVSLARRPNGEPLFFISQIQDITERKQNEASLREAAAEIEKLRSGLLTVCAWTKQMRVDGHWIPVDEFLTKHLRLKLTHGISEKAKNLQRCRQLAAPRRILLVDDERAVLKVTQLMLQQSGYEVIVAADAESALKLAPKDERFDLLVIDIYLRRMDGRTLAKKLSHSHPHLPVLFLSGHPLDSPIAHNGTEGFLLKPFTRAQLNNRIARLFSEVPVIESHRTILG